MVLQNARTAGSEKSRLPVPSNVLHRMGNASDIIEKSADPSPHFSPDFAYAEVSGATEADADGRWIRRRIRNLVRNVG